MNHFKRLSLIALFLIATSAVCAQNTDRLDFVVRHITRKPAVKHASLAVCVHNITKDSTVYTRSEDLAMAPAAINKLFTTAAAYNRLGPKFTFETFIQYAGKIDAQGTLHGDIIIVGTGDPFFCSDRFRHTDSTFYRIADMLRGKGIRNIDGHIYADTALFDDDMALSTWQWGDIGNYYGSGACGLNYNENSVDVHFRAAHRIGDPAVITSSHPEIPFENHVVTGPRGTEPNICFYGSPYENRRICRGTIPLGTNDTHARASLPHPAYYMAKELTQHLRKHGINVSGEPAVNFEMPKQVKTIGIDSSFNLFTITALTTQTNSNIAAESLFKLLGYLSEGHGTFLSGHRCLYEFFRTLKLDTTDINMVDGSGLSRDNRVTAYFTCQFLDAIARQTFFPDFVGALGISAKMPEYSIIPEIPEGCSLKIKSGVMPGIRNYVGYFTNENDEMFSFSILCNNYDCDDSSMDLLIKDILEEIIQF